MIGTYGSSVFNFFRNHQAGLAIPFLYSLQQLLLMLIRTFFLFFPFFFFFFFCPLGPHGRHMEVPRLGIESEL